MKKVIYLDNAATTKVRPEVVEAMLPYFTEFYGNPSSVYEFSTPCKKAMAHTREVIADALGAKENEIYFTNGGTESDNWALKAAAEAYGSKGKHIITTQIEHHAVLHTGQYLEKNGFEVTYLPVDENGLVNLKTLKAAIRPDTILISVMFANNEIGTIQPIEELAHITNEYGAVFHTDAVQAAGKIHIDVNELGIDLLTFSGHKIYAPKGIGVLYVDIELREKLKPIIHGGQQERGLRAGTENIPYIIGLGKACDIIMERQDTEILHIKKLRDTFEKKVLENIPDTYVNGHHRLRVPSISDIVFRYIEGEALMVYAQEVCCSAGSACTSAATNPSHVLSAIKVNDVDIHGALRFSFGRFNTMEEVNRAVEVLKDSVEKLRKMSPLYNK